MNRWLTWLLPALAALAIAAVVTLRACRPDGETGGRVLDADPAAIQTIRLRSGGEAVEIRRDGAGWEIVGSDFEDRADDAAVAHLLGAATSLAYSDRIPSSELRKRDDLNEFGLRSPKRWIELEGRDRHRLLLGRESAIEDRVYVRREDSHTVYLVEDRIVALVESGRDALRDRRISDIDPGQVDRVVVRAAEGELEMALEPSGWVLTRPLSARADAAAIERFLEQLLGARIVAFERDDSGDLGAFGIEEGRGEIAIYAGGRTRPVMVRFGQAPGSNTVYAQLTARDSIVQVPRELAKLAEVRPDALRDRSLLPVNLDIVDRIAIQREGRTLDIEREGEGWRLADGGVPASSDAVRHFTETLGATRVAEFRSATVEDRPPDARVTFEAVLSENTPEATAGSQTVAAAAAWRGEAGGALVQVEGQAGTMQVDEDVVGLFDPDPAAWRAPVAR